MAKKKKFYPRKKNDRPTRITNIPLAPKTQKKETKKPKKDSRKSPQLSVSEPRPTVEVVRKPRKQREGEES